MEFSAKDEERMAIDDELGGKAAFFKVRGGGLLCGEEGGKEAGEGEQDWQRGKVDSHDGRESTTGEFRSNSALLFQ